MLRTRYTDQELAERGWWACDCCGRMFDPEVEDYYRGFTVATGDTTACQHCANR